MSERVLAETFTQPHLARVLMQALRLSAGEASRRVRAAEQLGEREAMTGQPLPASRPALAAVHRTPDAGPEQVDVYL